MTPPRQSSSLSGFLQAYAGMVQMFTVLERERQVLELRRFPALAEIHWQITLRLHELADDYDRLTQAREILLGERKRARLVELEPPRRPVAPSEQITETGRAIARVLSTVMGE